jgi:riboflavin synthase
MFTGIIEEIGILKKREAKGDGFLLKISAKEVLKKTKNGDSIAINGACQTVTKIGADFFQVFVSKITASLTTLSSLKVNQTLNLERAMLPTSRFGGHLVQGHVDTKGKIKKIIPGQNGSEIEINIPDEYKKYLISKGSITVDGISLTIVSLTKDGFIIYLIPETLGSTIAERWQINDEVNLETDLIAKYIENMLMAKENNSIDKGNKKLKNKLMEEGFL